MKNKGEKEQREVLAFPPKNPNVLLSAHSFISTDHRLFTTTVSCSRLNSCGNGFANEVTLIGFANSLYLISLSMRWHYNGIDLGQ